MQEANSAGLEARLRLRLARVLEEAALAKMSLAELLYWALGAEAWHTGGFEAG